MNEPPRYRDYLAGAEPAAPVPERVPDPHYRSTIVIMLDDEPAIDADAAARGFERDPAEPPANRVWRATDQGEAGVLAEFAGTREAAIAWALERPNVERIYLYSEETRDVAPLERRRVHNR